MQIVPCWLLLLAPHSPMLWQHFLCPSLVLTVYPYSWILSTVDTCTMLSSVGDTTEFIYSTRGKLSMEEDLEWEGKGPSSLSYSVWWTTVNQLYWICLCSKRLLPKTAAELHGKSEIRPGSSHWVRHGEDPFSHPRSCFMVVLKSLTPV